MTILFQVPDEPLQDVLQPVLQQVTIHLPKLLWLQFLQIHVLSLNLQRPEFPVLHEQLPNWFLLRLLQQAGQAS